MPRSASLAPNKHHFDYALERFWVENNNHSPPTAVTTEPRSVSFNVHGFRVAVDTATGRGYAGPMTPDRVWRKLSQ